MSMTSLPEVPASDQIAESRDTSPASVRRGPGFISMLALLIALIALLIPNYVPVRQTVERYAGPLPWLPRHFTEADLSTAAAITASEPSIAAELAAFQSQIDGLTDGLVVLREADQRTSASLADLLSEVEKAAKIDKQIYATKEDAKRSEEALSRSVARLEESYSLLSAPLERPLIAAKLVLLAANGTLTPSNVEVLATAVGTDPALTAAAARLKTLASEDVPTYAALFAAFRERAPGAADAARRLRESGWDSVVGSVNSFLSQLSLGGPTDDDKDSIVLIQATRQLDNGRLSRAVFELQAASPELRHELASWISAAELRMSFDAALMDIVNGLLKQTPTPSSNASAG